MVKIRDVLAGSVLLSALLVTGLAQAQGAGAFNATGETCRDITWKPEVLAKYPNVAAACQGVMTQNGVTYVKFSGTVANNSPAGVRMKFKGTQQSVLIKPKSTTVIHIGDQDYQVRDLVPGQELTFYVPSNNFVASFMGDQPTEIDVVEIVEITPLPAAEPAPAQVASAEPLPATASDLPLLALFGALFTVMAIAFALLRRRNIAAGRR